MPRRKRHFVFCKKGLHLLSKSSRIKKFTRKKFEDVYVVRYCLPCRTEAKRLYYLKTKRSKLVKDKPELSDYKERGHQTNFLQPLSQNQATVN